jgi:heme exporter protein CcmD
MLNLGPHSAFILGSYLACATIIGALTIWIISDSRARKRELAALDTRRRPDARR